MDGPGIASVQIKSEPIDKKLPAEQRAIDQPANMAKSKESDDKPKEQEDKRNAGQPKLALSSSSRERLFVSLNQLSAILQSNQSPSDAVKQRARAKIKECILWLVDLSPFEQASSANESTEDPSVFEPLTYELSGEEQTQVVNVLMTNQNAILFDDAMSDEAKRNLIAENRRIVVQLLDLPCRVNSDGDLRSNNTETSSKRQKVKHDPNDELRAVIESQEKKIANLEARMDRLKNELKQEIRSVDITRSEATFKFELNNVFEFFETEGWLHSDRFWCKGLVWSIRASRKTKSDRSKQLGIYLFCHNDDSQRWSCKVDYRLILFSQLPEMQNNSIRLTYTFGNRSSFGCSQFIGYRELVDEKNGYIKNDQIVLGVEMKAGPVYRGAESEYARNT